MPKIIQSSTLRNKYNELSEFCNNNDEPAFVTKNGEGDLAVMSITHYESIEGRLKLYKELIIGMQDVAEGRVKDIDDVFEDLEKE